MKNICTISIVLLLLSCTSQSQKPVTLSEIATEQTAGNFSIAKKSIDRYMAENSLTPLEIYQLNARKDTMDRIAIDFRRTKEEVVEYIKKYYPNVTDEMLVTWENEKALEVMTIDGEKRYFANAARNLFRINKHAHATKLEIDGTPTVDNVEEVLKTHLPQVVANLSKSGKTQDKPVKMKVTYKVTLKPNVVPDGEMVRCWLPYPREDNRRQTNVQLLSVSSDTYTIAPDGYPQRTLYMQKRAEKDKELAFAMEFTYASAAEWFNLADKQLKPYDTNSELYKTHTSERSSHVIFTEKIKEVSEKVVGNETNPYLIVRNIFDYISETYPWASAREYATIPNIPTYVLDSKHGDCGQVSLLFITLARYNGIPAKWQSGFMMHPNGLNLHDWAEVYFEGIGWVPVDQSFGRKDFSDDPAVKHFFSNGIDAYRWIVNDDFSQELFPAKTYLRSETVDFQRGELEWRGGNIYFNQWNWDIEVEYLK